MNAQETRCGDPVGESAMAQVPPDERRASRSGANPRAGPYGRCGAGCREDAGRVIEPRNRYSRGHQDSPPSNCEGKADGFHAPEGSRPGRVTGERSGHHRGRRAGQVCRGGVRERGRATMRLGKVPDRGAGGENLRAQRGGVILGPGWECRRGSHHGSGARGRTAGRREGVVAVVAEPSTEGLWGRTPAEQVGN